MEISREGRRRWWRRTRPGTSSCSIFCPHHAAARKGHDPERHALGAVLHAFKHDKKRIGHSRNELLDILCVLYGGIEAERLLLGDVSTGASGVRRPALGPVPGHRSGRDLRGGVRHERTWPPRCGPSATTRASATCSPGSMAEAIDRQVNTIIVESQARAAAILAKHKADLIAVRDELLEKKTIEGERRQGDHRRPAGGAIRRMSARRARKSSWGPGPERPRPRAMASPRPPRRARRMRSRPNSQVGGRRCFCFLPSPRWGEGLGVRGEVPAASQHPLTPTLSPRKAGEREKRKCSASKVTCKARAPKQVYGDADMAEMIIMLRRDPNTGKQNIIIKLDSEPDALPIEHEQQHRELVGQDHRQEAGGFWRSHRRTRGRGPAEPARGNAERARETKGGTKG